ncbi:MAG: hypothetical protein IKR13_02485 [Victivallales bacterium]|nr:hypothetical protein [Victivallales bacterium]
MLIFLLLILTVFSGLIGIAINSSAILPAAPEDAQLAPSRWHTGCVRASKTLLFVQVIIVILDVVTKFCDPNWPLLFRTGLLIVYLPVFSAFVWGLLAPRKYSDGKLRTSFSHLLRQTTYCGIQCAILFVSYSFFFFSQASHEYTIQADTRNHANFRTSGAGRLADQLVPDGARDITLYFQPGDFLGGGKAELRCICTQEELQAFAAKNNYDFQAESITKNANPQTGSSWDIDCIHFTWKRFHPEDDPLAPPEYPSNFLAYNYRYGNGGGFSFLYDVEAQTLYASYDHN